MNTHFVTAVAVMFSVLSSCTAPSLPTPDISVTDQSVNVPYTIVTTTRSANVDGSICPDGGVVIDTGFDANGNGILDDTEISESYTLCNGTDAIGNRVEISDELAGSNCLYGGKKLDVGTDINDNGTLEPSEITDTQYFCSMLMTLVDITTEAPGANCTFGGSKLISGVDLNGNGILDTDTEEVQSVDFICSKPNLLVASHTCRVQLGVQDVVTDITVQYRLDEYRNGEIEVTGEIMSPLLGVSRSVKWSPWIQAHQPSWEEGVVRVSYDIVNSGQNTANGGYWVFDLDRDPDATSAYIVEADTELNITYTDDDLVGPLLWGPINIASCIAAM